MKFGHVLTLCHAVSTHVPNVCRSVSTHVRNVCHRRVLCRLLRHSIGRNFVASHAGSAVSSHSSRFHSICCDAAAYLFINEKALQKNNTNTTAKEIEIKAHTHIHIHIQRNVEKFFKKCLHFCFSGAKNSPNFGEC